MRSASQPPRSMPTPEPPTTSEVYHPAPMFPTPRAAFRYFGNQVEKKKVKNAENTMTSASTITPRFVTTAPHGTGPGSAGAEGALDWISSSSAALTPECAAGSSRNHTQKPTAQAKPNAANTKNAARQPIP